jgi:choline dehydrogenase-like flavoprotein
VNGAITRNEQQLRLAAGAVGLLSVAFIVMYVVTAVTSVSHYPFVANSLSKDGLFAALALIAVTNIQRYAFAVVLLIGAHLALVAGMALVLIFGDVSTIAGTFEAPLGIAPDALVWIWLGADVVIALALGWLYARAQRARFELEYLSGVEFGALMALAEVLAPDPKHKIEPYQVAKRADTYLASFSAQGKWKVKLALFGLAIYPLFMLRAPFSMMSPEARVSFINRHFLDDVSGHRLPPFLATLAQSMIRAAQQMAFLGFYEDPRAQERCDYKHFTERDGAAEKIRRVRRRYPPLDCLTPARITSDELAADVVVIGSGAGGAVLAYELAARDREVLILERGRHVDPADFTEVESTQLSNLYADGALTLSRDFRFQVLQGMCVGGSTVVNNGVCFDLPDSVRDDWLDPDGLEAGLDPIALRKSFEHLHGWLPVVPLKPADPLNPGWKKFIAGINALGLKKPPYNYDLVSCNIVDCLGCGYCNIGCAYGKKLSMLDNVLPRAQAKFPGAVRVLAECSVERIETRGGRAIAARCRLADGRKLRVRANTIVLSAGAIGSSMILARSKLGGSLVGKQLGFNIGSPLTADFEDVLHSEQGIQISHYLEQPNGGRAALETWFNPIASQSLFMPGWFHDHYENMLRYKNMTCLGAVVGSRRNAIVKPARLGGGVALTYVPHPDDLKQLRDGLKLAGKIMLAAGALRVMPASYRYIAATDPGQLEDWDRLLPDDAALSINTAHPQGGNCLSSDRDKGVVDPSFKVWDVENLFVCDASVFPAPITVNPQLTVMALAHYAAAGIAG